MGAALAEDIQTRKQTGEVIIIDRSPLAVLAYNGYGSQLENQKLAFDACEALFNKWQIDLLIFLSAPASALRERREKRGTKDYFESKGLDYHARVSEGYRTGLTFIQKHPDLGASIVTIDASPSIDEVHNAIVETLSKADI